MADYYLWLKAIHIFAVTSWMAGMLYLPRLFVYHADADPGSVQSETFKVMERRLLATIIHPSMIVVVLSGGFLLFSSEGIVDWEEGWAWVKGLMVVGLLLFHCLLFGWSRGFRADRNAHSAKFYRIWNEVPAILLAVIVIMVVVRPV